MTSPNPRCPALHPLDAPARCGRESGHSGRHRLPSGPKWDNLDLMDGGVTAALIEQETEQATHQAREPLTAGMDLADIPLARTYSRLAEVPIAFREHGACCGPLDEDVRFRHARWHEAADQRDARDAMARLWKEAARRKSRDARSYRTDAMVEEARADGLARAHRACHKQKLTAEQERDNLRAEVDEMWPKVKQAAQSRRFTAEDVDDAMIERAWTALVESPGWRIGTLHEDGPTIRRALRAALTPPPARPEGAEQLDEAVDAAIRGCSDITSPETVRHIADCLATDGIRASMENPGVLEEDLAALAETMLPGTDRARADWLTARGWRKADQ